MDVAEHLANWIVDHVADEEQHKAFQDILRAIDYDETLIQDRSWPELREIGRRLREGL